MFGADYRSPGGATIWAIGVFVAGVVVRIGWEVGGKLWQML